MTRPTRDEWALNIADEVATMADCTRSQVGAVILNKRKRFLGVGYNGLMPGIPGCKTAGNCPRGRLSYADVAPDSDYSNCAADHAERNAIRDVLDKGIHPDELKEAILYVTRKPCPACQTLITAVGIERVIVRGDK
ncbi:deoxycytidylate deaminase [Streptomyces phage Endor1]|uniref:Deoxycytidylate deaminase n=2 Tax=Camvirus TaxID=1982879 RepID=A0A7G4AWZ8_9CAUD|nr:dCMP deaminase [Streptomyces phage Endor1]QMP84538.1 deoxycytidylate deaminase [Streptomyces phage Endor1]